MPERSGRSRRNDALMRAFLSFSFSRRPVPCRFSRSGWELTQAERHRTAANAQVASFVARADARMAVDHHDPVFLCTPPACAARGSIERRDREHLAPSRNRMACWRTTCITCPKLWETMNAASGETIATSER